MDLSSATSSSAGYNGPLSELMRRDCVVCPNTVIACPTCSTGKVCIQRAGSCTQCTANICVPEQESGALPPSTNSGGGANIGAIVGGIVAGLVVIAIATFLAWRFLIRNRRQNVEDGYEEESLGPEKSRANDRQSTYTMASVASGATNVIKIAFFPGVAAGNEDLVPPVPPVPIPTSESGGSRAGSPFKEGAAGGDYYITLGELRDSRYDGFSDDGTSIGDRRSQAASFRSGTQSMYRNSVASTIYRSDAIVSAVPAQAVSRARAAVVSVKTSNPGSPALSHVPSLPSIDYEKYGGQQPLIQVTAPNSNLTGSTASLSAPSAASVAAGSSTTGANPQLYNIVSPSATESSSASIASTQDGLQKESPQLMEAIQQATHRASLQPTHRGLGSSRRDLSPFADSNAIPENEAI